MLERGQGRAARARHVEVGHEREAGDPGLLFAQDRVLADLGQEPLAELGRGLDHAAAHEVGAGVGEVRRDREEAADAPWPAARRSAAPWDRPSRRRVRTSLAAWAIDAALGQLVVREAGQPVGQQVLLDAGERGHALRVAVEAAVAVRERLALGQQALHGDVDVAELARHARRALDDPSLPR